MKAHTIYLHALTPIHSGVGRAADIVDLPIAREKSTGWPVLPASGLKGALRDLADGQLNPLFGSQDAGGSIALSDLRILLLPIRSFYGTFAWVTCPLALARFARDAKALGMEAPNTVPDVAETTALVGGASGVTKGDKLILEDLDLEAKSEPSVATVGDAIGRAAGIDGIAARLAIVSDTLFSFLCETATEVAARIKLQDDVKTVQKGGLWWEEAVPAEAVFYGFALVVRKDAEASQAFTDLIQKNPTIFLGGNTTVGRGLCRMKVAS